MIVHVHVCSVACNEFSLHKYAQNRGNSVKEICMPCRREDDDELQVHVHVTVPSEPHLSYYELFKLLSLYYSRTISRGNTTRCVTEGHDEFKACHAGENHSHVTSCEEDFSS